LCFGFVVLSKDCLERRLGGMVSEADNQTSFQYIILVLPDANFPHLQAP
jgi:hypothetical protein